MSKEEAINSLKDTLKVRSDGYYDYLANGGKGNCAEEQWLDTLAVAIQVLTKLGEIEMCIDACENCITYQGVKEFPESKAYETIKKTVTGGVGNND